MEFDKLKRAASRYPSTALTFTLCHHLNFLDPIDMIDSPPLHPSQRLRNLFEKIADSSVTRAQIRYEGLTDREAFALAEALNLNESLIELDLTRSCVSTAGLIQVCQSLPSALLEKLSLSGNPISPSAATSLNTFLQSTTRLRELNLHDCDLRGDGLAALGQVLSTARACPLESISLSSNRISSNVQACASLGGALQHLQSLKSLGLSRNKLESRGLQALQLHRVPALEVLELWDNKLSPSSGVALRDILTHCRHLKELNVRGNELGNVGVGEAFALNTSISLEKLFLTDNLLSDGAAQQLAQLFQEKPTKLPNLVALYLSCNEIGDDGAVALAEALSVPTTMLHTLDLYRNKIENRGGYALSEAHAANVRTRDLCITFNRITATEILRAVRFYGKLNASGRYMLRQTNAVPLALWPLVLENMNVKFDVRYYFVRGFPDLFDMRKSATSTATST